MPLAFLIPFIQVPERGRIWSAPVNVAMSAVEPRHEPGLGGHVQLISLAGIAQVERTLGDRLQMLVAHFLPALLLELPEVPLQRRGIRRQHHRS